MADEDLIVTEIKTVDHHANHHRHSHSSQHGGHENDHFDLKLVFECMQKCLDNDLDLEAYVETYRQLNKLFVKLGGLFKFIVHDITEKTCILSQHLQSDLSVNYSKISMMLDYEKQQDVFNNPPPPLSASGHHHYVNGSRTLLRLHRSLIFVIKLIDGIRQSNDDDRVAPVAKAAYDNTLAHYHPWLVRKGVHLAVYTLPHRKQLIADIAGDHVTANEADKLMELTVTTGQQIYDAVEQLYTSRCLQDLL